MSPRTKWVVACALATVSAVALAFPARVFDVVSFTCGSPPAAMYGAATITAASALGMAVAWWMAVRATAVNASTAFRLLPLALAPHAVMLALPIFLSRDAIFYAALDRLFAHYQGDPYRALSSTMDRADPFWRLLSEQWRAGTSAYFPGFHLLCRLIGQIAGDQPRSHLALHQLVACASILGVAFLSASASRESVRRSLPLANAFTRMRGTEGDVGARAYAAGFALVALCPLSILEATSSAHNDAEMALATAGALHAWTHGRRVLSCVLVCGAALIKPTGILIAVAFILAVMGSAVHSRHAPSSRATRIVLLALATSVVAAFLVALPLLERVTEMFNRDHALFMSLHAPEAIPRTVLYAVGRHELSFDLGTVIRVFGVVWVVVTSAGAMKDGRTLPRFLLAMFGFYVFFAGVSNAWYLLPLIAFVPCADARWLRAIVAGIALVPLCYATELRFQCGMPPGWAFWTVVTLTQGALAFGASLALRVRDRSVPA